MHVLGVLVVEKILLGPERARLLASEKQPRGVHEGVGTPEEVVDVDVDVVVVVEVAVEVVVYL